MAGDTWLKPLEALVNRHISASSRARELLADLDGRVLALVFRGTPLAIYLVAQETQLALSASYQSDPDAVLRGTPLALASLARGGESPGTLEIEGDAEVARRFQALLQAARPDWEEELARVTGDTAAHAIGNAFRAFTRWSGRAASSFTRDAAEFLQEESRDLPARGEVEIFDAELEALRSELARAESRIARLEEKLARSAR
jgi:ubiquinone biosynthesis protein UbiJ